MWIGPGLAINDDPQNWAIVSTGNPKESIYVGERADNDPVLKAFIHLQESVIALQDLGHPRSQRTSKKFLPERVGG